jgi:cell division septation protein DedD
MSSRSFATSFVAVVFAATCAGAVAPSADARPAPPTPTPSPSPTPVADPSVTKLVRQQFVAWQAGSINKSLYSDKIQSQLSDATINDVSQKLASLGALTSLIYIGPFISSDIPPDARGYIYQMQCREGNVYLFTILDSQGKIATIYFKDKLVTETVEVPASASTVPTASPSS